MVLHFTKYYYYNDNEMSPYYTTLLKEFGKSFSIPQAGEEYPYNHYDKNAVEILMLIFVSLEFSFDEESSSK